VNLVSTLDKSIQRQRFIPFTLTAATPGAMIRWPLFKLAAFRTNYRNFTYGG
jgi:hypothetical protein